MSLIGTFGVMYLAGYSLDNLSLMALTVATGFVVDDAIVVLENITRHVEHGMTPFEAALLGAREVGFTVLSMSLSLIAVFIPILLMGGIIGRLFREFAVTLSVAILVSLVVSLTTTPMMCARLLKRRPPSGRAAGTHGPARAMERGRLLSVRKGYARSLDWALRHPLPVLLMLFATIGLNIYLYAIVPKGFFPQQDTGRMFGPSRPTRAYRFRPCARSSPTSSRSSCATRRWKTSCLHRRRPAQPRLDVHDAQARGRAQASGQPGRCAPARQSCRACPAPVSMLQPVQDIRTGGRPADATV